MTRLFPLLILAASAAVAQRPALPEFVSGDQCLFCHRNDIGPAWQRNRHNRTVLPVEGSTERFTLGGGARRQRQLRKTGYGRFALLDPRSGEWQPTKFNDRCAGCHTTAVDGGSRAFTVPGIDCYACHGAVDLEHSNDTSLILLSRKNRTAPRVVASICGSCHLRGGSSQAKGFPYAFHFVPGDDLFADFRYPAFAPAAEDRHIYTNINQVVQNTTDVSCLNCHQVHASAHTRHRRVLTSAICLDCHYENGPKKNVRPYAAGSALCEY